MNWDQYWLALCDAHAKNSKCLSRKIGAIIVKDGKYEVSSGYNGPVVGAPHCTDKSYRRWLFQKICDDRSIQSKLDMTSWIEAFLCPRQATGFKSGAGLIYCQAAHAERNAIATAARLGRSVEGCTMYMNCGIPCLECAKAIVNAGITEVVVTKKTVYETKGITGLDILRSGHVQVREYRQNE